MSDALANALSIQPYFVVFESIPDKMCVILSGK